jgi:hypothetical protein
MGKQGLRTVAEHFRQLEDPRVERAKVHSLLAMIAMALCEVICGAESWVEIAEFGRAKAAWFATFLELPSGIPSHDTLGRVFARLGAAAFEAGFTAWMEAVAAVLPLPPLQERVIQQVVALDGKTLRRSHDRGAGQLALHLVSAWASANRLLLTQLAVAEKSNEITAFPAVLRQLDLAGCLVTIDAMGCRTAVAEQVLDQQADYVLALKENQANLYEEVVASFTLARASGFAGSPRAPGATGGRWARAMGAWRCASTGCWPTRRCCAI